MALSGRLCGSVRGERFAALARRPSQGLFCDYRTRSKRMTPILKVPCLPTSGGRDLAARCQYWQHGFLQPHLELLAHLSV